MITLSIGANVTQVTKKQSLHHAIAYTFKSLPLKKNRLTL
ncbi:hypothetical protein M23134_03997 [Microscilla marina ATCC 23134]|uniref:Uncharacterized protein n=1 Tax=Microscilla marina ATCC 23134 TaxID=313606 RepID=A1ZMQ4_MICM2|nr:hypothetical protein M23134_03997 [Microscilla marina ATCC 23134]